MEANCSIQCLVWITLATVTLPALHAERHRPGRIASVSPRFVQRALIVIPARINQKGLLDFMVDTGSQITVVDPSPAVELGLKPGTNRRSRAAHLRYGIPRRHNNPVVIGISINPGWSTSVPEF